MEGGMKVLSVLVWGFFVFLLISVCLQDLELQLPPQSSAWASSWRTGCGFDQPQPCASIPACSLSMEFSCSDKWQLGWRGTRALLL